MAETYGITPVPIRAAILPQNNRSIFDINALFKAHALKQEDARLKLTESKYAADAMLETHKLFEDFKYLPKDSQTVDEVFAPVNVLMERGISNLEDAMNARNGVIKGFNDPRIRKVVNDRQKWEGLVKAGQDYKDELGNNTIKYTQYLTELANTPGADLESANINPFFDTEKAARDKAKDQAQTKGLEAQTNIYNAQAESLAAKTKSDLDWTAHIDAIGKKYDMPDAVIAILRKPENATKPLAEQMLLAGELAFKDNTPGLTKEQKYQNNLEIVMRAGKYEPTPAGGSTSTTISFGNKVLDDAYGKESNQGVVIPDKKNAAGDQLTVEFATKKNPHTGVWTRHPEIVEAMKGANAVTFYTVVGTGANKQVLSINPNIDNNPTDEPKDKVNTTDFGTNMKDTDVFDTDSSPFSEGGWTDAVSVQGTGKTLFNTKNFAGLDPWFDKITVSRDDVTKGLVIKYPGKSKVPIYFRMVNEKDVDAKGENAFGDIETNNIQIVQAHIKKLLATKQITPEEISKQIIFSNDEGGNPKFTMKNMIFNLRRMSGITQSDIAPIMELDNIGRNGKPVTAPAPIVDQVPQALIDNANINRADTATTQYFEKNAKFLNPNGDSLHGVLQLHPSVLKTLKTATENNPGLLQVITDFTNDPTRHDLTREGKASDHHEGLAIDLSVRNQGYINGSLELIRRLQKTKAVRVVLLEYGSDKERRELSKEIEANTGLIEDKEVDGVTFKLRQRSSVGATGSNIHISFRNTVPVTQSQARFDADSIGRDSLINTPGF